MKRDSVSEHVHRRRDLPFPLYAAVHILDELPPSSVVYVHNRQFLNKYLIQSMREIRKFYEC